MYLRQLCLSKNCSLFSYFIIVISGRLKCIVLSFCLLLLSQSVAQIPSDVPTNITLSAVHIGYIVLNNLERLSYVT